MCQNQKDNSASESGEKKDSHLQGLGRLSVEAIIAVTDIVESLHKRINPISRTFSASDKQQLSGIGGLVYRHIRSVTELVGKSIDAPLAIVSKNLGAPPFSASTEALLSALNGVLGDHLENRKNPMAIPMQLRKNGKVLDSSQLSEIIVKSNGKLLIMVHGLCMNDLQWRREGHNHGDKLAQEFGMTTLYLHYNTGRHIAENGKQFSELLESVNGLADKDLEINLLVHSMGGLVSRSALYIAESEQYHWPKQLNKLIFLGTPHHGAPLEKAGNWIDLILGKHSYTIPFARLVKVRSAGITDLRYGNVKETDRQTQDRFEFVGDQRSPLPLPSHVQCFAVATCADKNIKHPLGDGLVTLKSALGKHNDPAFDLKFPTQRTWTGSGINHMQLLSDQKVYEAIKRWF
jgi:hypothetical protein